MLRGLLIVFLLLFVLPAVLVGLLYTVNVKLNSMHTASVLADEDCQDMEINPLEETMIAGDTGKFRVLLEAGADPNEVTNCYGQTPLFSLLLMAESYRPGIVVNDNPFDMLDLLIRHVADLNHVDKLGNTPLNWLIIGFPREKQHLEVGLATVLINAGADPHLSPQYPCYWLFECSDPTPYENSLMHGKFLLAAAIRARPGHVDPDDFADLAREGERTLLVDRMMETPDRGETMRLGYELFQKDTPNGLLTEKERDAYIRKMIETYP